MTRKLSNLRKMNYNLSIDVLFDFIQESGLRCLKCVRTGVFLLFKVHTPVVLPYQRTTYRSWLNKGLRFERHDFTPNVYRALHQLFFSFDSKVFRLDIRCRSIFVVWRVPKAKKGGEPLAWWSRTSSKFRPMWKTPKAVAFSFKG